MDYYDVLKKPLVSEKSYRLAAGLVYTFEVDPRATKPEIARAVEALYKGTKVRKVAVSRLPAKISSWHTPKKKPVHTYLSSKKRALVTLSAGKIELFEGGVAKEAKK